MVSLTVNYWGTRTMDAATNPQHWRNSTFMSGNFNVIYDVQKAFYPRFCKGLSSSPRAFARRNPGKKLKKNGQSPQSVADISPKDEYGQDDYKLDPSDSLAQKLNTIPARSTVLQACIVTSGLIAAFGVVLRQVSYFASTEGLPVLDCSSKVSFDFEMWHIELITGLVVVISSCRYLLLKTWPDFAESSEAANQQVLTSLQPLDYLIVAFLPGVSEELLFRGALLPLFGFDWKSVLVVAALFGVLHIGGGRKYSFAIWATFVGLLYGYATILSSSIIVPMASHALNNLVGGILWRYESSSSEQK
ncbi:CAAX amino terminal protease [Trema orientale]|uniref:CAAX amino terminal protease n=1 Tax=Trema orientale TaxID=63057 RepID=A0A2P5F0V5_TREOI|nr:CAAX amino terminal protease [Trema orientale]